MPTQSGLAFPVQQTESTSPFPTNQHSADDLETHSHLASADDLENPGNLDVYHNQTSSVTNKQPPAKTLSPRSG